MKPVVFRFAIVTAVLLLAAPAFAQPAGPPAEPLALADGAATVRGTIRGDGSRRLVVDLTAGQTLRVTLDSPNGAANFNVWAPGDDTAMVIGSVVGPAFEGPVPSTGRYTIDLYLMRSAARRNEAAPFVLEVAVDRPGR